MSYLIFGGKDLTAVYNCIISSSEGKFTTPSRQYDVIEIPGKSGDLLIDKGRLSNYPVIYKCYINKDFMENYKAMITHLLSISGYSDLADSDGFKTEAYFLGNTEPKMAPNNKGGVFELRFSCKPEMYEKVVV